MSARAAVLRGREAAEALMIDTCEVRRPGGQTTDPDTGEVSTSGPVVYGPESPEKGKCKVQQTIAQSSKPEAGGLVFTVQDARIDFPVSAGPFHVNDVATLKTSELDPQLVGRMFRIVEVFHKSMATAQRTRVEEITS